ITPRLDSVFRSKAEKKVLELGYDAARLPPGQHLTQRWPVRHAGRVPRYRDLTTWTFRVFGEVENEIELSWEELSELPLSSNVQDIHGVPGWSRFEAEFEVVHGGEIAELVEPRPT